MIDRPAFRSLERFTQPEFARWLDSLPPGDAFHYELLDGFIVREPPAGWPHGHVAAEILSRLASFVREQKLGLVFDSSQGFDLTTGDTVEPDVSFVSNARWNSIPRPERGFLKIAPDLVFEILSPSTGRIDRRLKKRIYERNGVREYVLVNSKTRRFRVFHLDGATGSEVYGPGRDLGSRAVFASSAVPGFELAVGDVFYSD